MDTKIVIRELVKGWLEVVEIFIKVADVRLIGAVIRDLSKCLYVFSEVRNLDLLIKLFIHHIENLLYKNLLRALCLSWESGESFHR